MSVFILERSTYCKLLSKMRNPIFKQGKSFENISDPKITQLLLEAFMANEYSYYIRYSEPFPEDGDAMYLSLPSDPPASTPLISDIQFIKSIHCLTYNTEDEYWNHPAIVKLREIAREVAEDIIQDSPEYDKAVWG